MRRSAVLVLAVLAVLAACASPAEDGGAAAPTGGAAPTGDAGDPAAGGGITRTQNDLLIEIDLADGSPVQTWTLVCAGVAEGSHPDPVTACAHLTGMQEPFTPLPDDIICTEQYGGPETARITGQWAGEPVDLELSRVDGCRIAQWDSLQPALPATAGLPAG